MIIKESVSSFVLPDRVKVCQDICSRLPRSYVDQGTICLRKAKSLKIEYPLIKLIEIECYRETHFQDKTIRNMIG